MNEVVTLVTWSALVAGSCAAGLALFRQRIRKHWFPLSGSLSFYFLFVLSRSVDDRSVVIKEYYDWQHKLLLTVITGIVTFLGANVVLALQASVGVDDASKKLKIFSDSISLGSVAVVILLFLVLVTLKLFAVLARIPEEYRASISLYERLRRL
jgi:hypothetical protein